MDCDGLILQLAIGTTSRSASIWRGSGALTLPTIAWPPSFFS
jgi:hypothetical protein